jgi:predicted chitinase
MKLKENIDRLRMLMDLKEQLSNQDIVNQIESGDFSRLKEYLSISSDLRTKLNQLFNTSSIDELYNKLLTSNKTLVLKGMQMANQNKDMDLYQFLDKILKNSDKLS